MKLSDFQARWDQFQRSLASPAVLTELHRRMVYVVRGQFRVQRKQRLDADGRRMTPLASMTKRQRIARGKPVSDKYPELLSLWDAVLRLDDKTIMSWNPRRGRIGSKSPILPYHQGSTRNPRIPERKLIGIMDQPYDTRQRMESAVSAQIATVAKQHGIEMDTPSGARAALDEAMNESAR